MKTECCIKDCFKEVAGAGMCVNHWRMLKKHGSPVAPRPLSAIMRGKNSEERFWYSVEKSDGCWNWSAGRNRDNYGVFKGEVGGVVYLLAHRFSWALATGEVLSSSTMILHMCDNPSCVNPDHLRAGTAQENSDDMVNKGRQSKGENHSIVHAKFTEEMVRSICADPRPYERIAEAFNCHKQTVIDMKRRRTWTFLNDVVVVRNVRGSRGESRSKTLTEQDIRDIRASDDSNAALSKKYAVSQQTLCDIRKRRSWKHVV